MRAIGHRTCVPTLASDSKELVVRDRESTRLPVFVLLVQEVVAQCNHMVVQLHVLIENVTPMSMRTVFQNYYFFLPPPSFFKYGIRSLMRPASLSLPYFVTIFFICSTREHSRTCTHQLVSLRSTCMCVCACVCVCVCVCVCNMSRDAESRMTDWTYLAVLQTLRVDANSLQFLIV